MTTRVAKMDITFAAKLQLEWEANEKLCLDEQYDENKLNVKVIPQK